MVHLNCCLGVLRGLRLHRRPLEVVASPGPRVEGRLLGLSALVLFGGSETSLFVVFPEGGDSERARERKKVLIQGAGWAVGR